MTPKGLLSLPANLIERRLEELRRLQRPWRRRPPPGSAPGQMALSEPLPPPTIRVMSCRDGQTVESTLDDLDTLPQLLETSSLVWLDIDGLPDTHTVAGLTQHLKLHPMAIEDVLNAPQRPKVESYDDHDFALVRMLTFNDTVEVEQLGIFFTPRVVVTCQERANDGDCLDPIRQRLRNARGKITSRGGDYLAYALIDTVTDHIFPVLEALELRLVALEEAILTSGPNDAVVQIQQLKANFLTMRRALLPLRESLTLFLRDEESSEIITDETRIHFRDCLDHMNQLLDLSESYRELATGLLDVHLSMINHRMSGVMQLLTLITAIFIPLSFIAGLYGMNFDSSVSPLNMPELRWRWGYPVVLGVMATIAVTLLIFFWRRGWLTTPDRAD